MQTAECFARVNDRLRFVNRQLSVIATGQVERGRAWNTVDGAGEDLDVVEVRAVILMDDQRPCNVDAPLKVPV